MRVVYLTDQTYLHGGIEKVLSQKANYLADVMGKEVSIITYNQKNNNPCYSFSDKITFIDLAINYNIGKSYFHPANFTKILKHWSRLSKVLETIAPDVVVSSNFGPDFYFLPFLKCKIPIIKEFHATRFFSSQLTGIKPALRNKLSAIIEQKYSRLVVLNEDELPYYKSENVAVIPNPAEIDSPPTPLNNKQIIAAGRISYQKNFEDLIELGRRVFPEFPDWEIHIFGDDYLDRKANLIKMIREAGLENNIIFKGTSPDLKKTFQDYSIYAMTSNHETFPMVLLEALSVGLPVISYDCPTGPSRIITDGEDSFLIPYKNLDTFEEKLKLMMADEEMRLTMGKRALHNVKRFDIEKVMAQWKNLFDALALQTTK